MTERDDQSPEDKDRVDKIVEREHSQPPDVAGGSDSVDEAGHSSIAGVLGMPAGAVHGPGGETSDLYTQEWDERSANTDGAATLFEEHAGRPASRAPRTRGLVLGAALLVLLAGLVIAALMIAPMVSKLLESKDYEGPGDGAATIVVAAGDSGRAIGQTLEGVGVVKTATAFEKALEQTPGDEIQPGSYTLKTKMKAADALSALRDRATRNENEVTIREGLRASEIVALLSKTTGEPLSAYQTAAKNPGKLGLPEAAGGELEGYLFPATYTFDPSTTAAAQLSKLVSQATGRWSTLGVEGNQMQKVITIASIVEAEARLPQDRPKVAAVIENRLRIGMALQMDSTVAYGVGKRTLTTSDAERADNNPYNTYLHPGLPAGPIGNPGAASVQAALKPAPGGWLYFVTVNPTTGETRFAANHAEHQKNVAVFQQWCQANPGKC